MGFFSDLGDLTGGINEFRNEFEAIKQDVVASVKGIAADTEDLAKDTSQHVQDEEAVKDSDDKV